MIFVVVVTCAHVWSEWQFLYFLCCDRENLMNYVGNHRRVKLWMCVVIIFVRIPLRKHLTVHCIHSGCLRRYLLSFVLSQREQMSRKDFMRRVIKSDSWYHALVSSCLTYPWLLYSVSLIHAILGNDVSDTQTCSHKVYVTSFIITIRSTGVHTLSIPGD